jgi:hypothetical protein
VTRVPRNEVSPASTWVLPWNAEGLSNESMRRSVELASMACQEAAVSPQHGFRRGAVRERGAVRRAIAAWAFIGLAGMGLVWWWRGPLGRPGSPQWRVS